MLQLPINRALARLPSLGHGLHGSVADGFLSVLPPSVHRENRKTNGNPWKTSARTVRVLTSSLLHGVHYTEKPMHKRYVG